MKLRLACALSALSLAALAAFAQDEPQAPIPFEGGTLTITETEDLDKVLAFDGKELARNYVVFYDKTVEVNGTKAALFAVGDGGNQCGPAEVLVWKQADGDIRTQAVGEECGAPPAAITDSSIYFVPYLLPGATDAVQQWAPDTGLQVVGTIAYAPQPDTGWEDLDPTKFEYMIDAMKNAAVYAQAQQLLGDQLLDLVTGLQTGGSTETTQSGIYYASGCVPHACGSADSFMAIDPKAKRLYFAQQGDDPQKPSTWPTLDGWPDEIAELMRKAYNPEL
jgi:hypothetical protein